MREKGGPRMKNSKRMFLLAPLIIWITFILMGSDSEAKPNVFYGTVVATEGKILQVKGKDGHVSVFWLGHRTRFDTRVPFFGDRVRIEYVKDKLRRNAVTRVTILSK